MSDLNFKPQTITQRLITHLPDRAQDVVVKRYALSGDNEVMTLEAIGNIYGITRERVRQIENHALNKIRESEAIQNEQHVFDELRDIIHRLGIIVAEDDVLSRIAPNDQSTRNHTYLLLELGDHFERHKEDKHFKHRWHVDRDTADKVHSALKELHGTISEDDLISEQEIIDRFKEYLVDLSHDHAEDENVLKRWLRISKRVDSNPLGEWGLADSPNVRLKGMRDYAYLVIRQHGSPMHFREVTEKIEELFDKDAHVATTHNELIKDDRFVLVGRGLYALKEWGYMTGVVREVIEKILEKEGPLSKDEIVDRVLKERYVKTNTVLVNLQNNDTFTKTRDGKYTLS